MKATASFSNILVSEINFIAEAYSIASPKPMLGGKQNNIFFPILLVKLACIL